MKITPKEIESLESFQKLELFQKRLLIKKNNLELLQENIIFYKTTGKTNHSIGKSNVAMLNEYIEKNGIKPNQN